MNRNDIDLLVEQIRNIILNKPISEDLKSESEELADLQEAVFYLSNCLTEANEFLRHLRNGELDAKPPSRHNFLAGNLKELHSALKHLTWQADQVAHGDYKQTVDFLGDFSTSFNEMIHQLADREARLKSQSEMLSENITLMKSIMDGLQEWIIVTSQDSGEVIYTNESAKQFFYKNQTDKECCASYQEFLAYITHYRQNNAGNCIFEYKCDFRKKIFQIRSYAIQWNENLAYVHFITDITNEKAYQEQMEGLAYIDELTGLHNRRFCLDNLKKLLKLETDFTFCMVDLDGLKYANDNFGHAAGDYYLKTVAEQMLNISRTTDIVCRIGGDEFALIFPNCKAQIVLEKMEQIDQSLAAATKDFSMSISYGVIHVDNSSHLDIEEIIQQADEKMYILKKLKKATQNSQSGFVLTFTWTNDLATGNAQIDAEHKELIRASNNLLTACASGIGGSELEQTVEFLNQYTKTHFQHEEALQLEYQYPDYINHKRYHESFIRVVNDFSYRLITDGPTPQLVSEINRKLGGWLINHIKTEDVKVARHIINQKKTGLPDSTAQ